MTADNTSDVVGGRRRHVEERKERKEGREGGVAVTTRRDSASHLLGQLNVPGTLATKNP